MGASNPAGTKSASSIIDANLESAYRSVLRGALRGKLHHAPEFEVNCHSGGVYLGFQPFTESDRTFYGSDMLGIAYVYVADIRHHRRTDPIGNPKKASDFMHAESAFLDALNSGVGHLLHEECGLSLDIDFIRYNDEDPAGGVYFGIPLPRPSQAG